MSGLFQELKRRNVVRVTIAYVVVGWLVLQVSDILLDVSGAPDWVGKALVGLLVIGLVPTVIFAWAFDATPDGIKRDDGSQQANPTLDRRLNIVTIAAVIGLVVLVGWQQSNPPAQIATEAPVVEEEVPAVDDASIAVLPFEDMSPEGDQGYFSDGISEEILNVLVKVDGLSVASRTSAFAFKGKSEFGIPAIANELGVRHVLEGSVRKAGNKIRITAQLIDAQTDKHLWSDNFDRELTVENIFAIQDEIATTIVGELAESLQVGLDAESFEHAQPGTSNLNAYELFLRAEQRFRVRSTENLLQTIELYEEVVALDPEFAKGWAGLAAAYSVAPSWGHSGYGFDDSAIEAANRAIELDDSLSLPFAVLAQAAATNGQQQRFEQTFSFYNKALERDPDDATTILWRGIAYLEIGYLEHAKADLSRCLELEPSYENCRRFLSLAYLYSGDSDTGIALFEQSLKQGSSSQLMPFVPAYAALGDERSVLFLLQMDAMAFDSPFSINRHYRAMVDPQFDFEREQREFEIEFKSITGEELDWSQLSPHLLAALRKYDAMQPSLYAMIIWNPAFEHFMTSPHRKRLTREIGAFDYWQNHGYPPQCRPIGDDDFECD